LSNSLTVVFKHYLKLTDEEFEQGRGGLGTLDGGNKFTCELRPLVSAASVNKTRSAV